MTRPLGSFSDTSDETGTYVDRSTICSTARRRIDVSQVDVSTDGIELQDREFIAAIRAGREPNFERGGVLPCIERGIASISSSQPRMIEAHCPRRPQAR